MGAGVEYLSNQPGNVNSNTQHRHQVPAPGTPRTPYDEAKYLKTLQQRGSPLLKMAETA